MLSKKDFTGKLCENEKRICDAAFALLLVFFAIYYIVMARRGINTIDESFYYTIPHRFFLGDKPFVDEWHVSQLSATFQYLPYCIFRMFNSSNDGIILFFRYFYTAVHCLVTAVVYFGLRRRSPAAALVSAFAYGSYVPLYILAPNYYNLSISFSAVFCVLFFINKSESPLKYIACGIVFSCAVLAGPPIALLYFIYTAVLFVICIMKKNVRFTSREYGFLADTRIWMWLSIGIFISAAVFLAVFFSFVPFGEFLQSIPMMFTDSEYDFGAAGNIIELSNLAEIIKAYSPVALIAAVVFALYLFIRRKDLPLIRNASVSFLAVFYAVVTVYFFCSCLFVDNLRFIFQPVLLQFTAGLLILMSVQKDRRLISAWIFGLCVSVILDITSDTDVTPGIGSAIANIASIPIVFSVCRETVSDMSSYRQKKKSRQVKRTAAFLEGHASLFARTARASFSVFLVTLLISESCALAAQQHLCIVEEYHREGEQPLDVRLETGPYQGILTSANIAEQYSAYIKDLDIIKENCGGAVYIAGLNSWLYLYMDLPYGVYSTWFVADDCVKRNMEYWDLHPDKIPSYIYLPYYNSHDWKYNDKTLDTRRKELNEMFYLSSSKGDAGYIFRVNGIKDTVDF